MMFLTTYTSILLWLMISCVESFHRQGGLFTSIRRKGIVQHNPISQKNTKSQSLHTFFLYESAVSPPHTRRFSTHLFGRKGRTRKEDSSSIEDDDENENLIREMKLNEDELYDHRSIKSKLPKVSPSHPTKNDKSDAAKSSISSLTEEDFQALMHPDFLRAAQKLSDNEDISPAEEDLLETSLIGNDHDLVSSKLLEVEQGSAEEEEDEEDDVAEVEEIEDVEDVVAEDVFDAIEEDIEDTDNNDNTNNEEDDEYGTVNDRDTRDQEDYMDNNIDSDDDSDAPTSMNNNNNNNNYDENETDYHGDSYGSNGPYSSSDDFYSEDSSYSHDSDSNRDTVAEDSDNDPLENEYWRVLQHWEILEFWDPEKAALLAFHMTQALAEDQARRHIYSKLPETAFYRLYSGKERAMKRLKINRQYRFWKRKLLHARLTFKARCDAHRIARLSATSNKHNTIDNNTYINNNSNINKMAKEKELLLEENMDEENALIDEFLHNIDPDDETTYLVYSDKSRLGHSRDSLIINETLVHKRYMQRLEAFQDLQRRLNATRVSQDTLRGEQWNKLYLTFVAHPLDDNDTFETQRDIGVTVLNNAKSEKDEDNEEIDDDRSQDTLLLDTTDSNYNNNNTDKISNNTNNSKNKEGENEQQIIAENIDESDSFYEDFYVDQYDDRVETHRLQDTTYIYLKRLRDKLLLVTQPATRLMTQLQIVKHSVSREEHEMLRRVTAYWQDTYVSRYFFNRNTARQSEYDRVAQLYNYSVHDTYETQLQKRVQYDQRRFRLVAKNIAKTQDPEYRDKRLVVNETHAVMYIPTHLLDQETSLDSLYENETASVQRGENETVVVMRDYYRDNDDGVLVCPPTDEEIDRMNENNYRVIQEYAKRFYSHMSPTFKAPFGDPFETLAWHQNKSNNNDNNNNNVNKNSTSNIDNNANNTALDAKTPPSSSSNIPHQNDRPVLFIRALFSNFTGTGDTLFNMTHVIFDTIRRHTQDTPQIHYDIFVMERNASDHHRFFNILTPLQRDQEVQGLRDQMKRINRLLGVSYEDTERHLESRLPMEDMLHIWCEGHNVHHLLDGFTMVKLWHEMKPEIVLAPKNLQAIVSQVWYALHAEAQSHAVLTKRLSMMRLGQEAEPFDMRFVHGANMDNFMAGDETAVVGGRTAYVRSLGDAGEK